MSAEQRKMLMSLQVADFNVLEWVLFLHTHPDDLGACHKKKNAMKIAANIRKNYEVLYGPLTTLTPISCTKVNCTPWPWQV